MQRRWLAAAALLLAACGGSKGLCGGQQCAQGQRCDLTDARCVFDEPPRLALTTPADQSQVTANPLPFAGTASDDEGVPKVEWSVDGATWTEVLVTDGKFADAAALPALDGKPMTLSVRATDKAGQVTTVLAGLSVDDVAPPCEQLSPMPLEVFKTGAVDIRFRASGYLTLDVTLDGKSITPTVAGDEVSYAWPVPTEDWITHIVDLIATDAAGNVCKLHSGFVVDNVPPVISFEQPTEGQVMGLDLFGVEFAFGPASDGSKVINTVVDVDDGKGFVQSGIWGDHWVVGRDAPMGEDFVPHVIKARATDLAGNVTELDGTWVADVVPPRLTILTPLPGDALSSAAFNGTDDVTVSWSVADGDPRLTVISPQLMGQTFAPPVMSFDLPTSPTDNGAPYMVELTAVTRTGTTTGTVGFTVDRVPPTWTSNPPPGSRMVTSPVVIDFSEPTNRLATWWQGVLVTWNDAGTQLTVVEPQTDWPFQLDFSAVRDRAGNFLAPPLSATYRSAPAYWPPAAINPDAGLWTLVGADELFASADRESVLTFALREGTPPLIWSFDVSPQQGGYVEYCGFPNPNGFTVDANAFFQVSSLLEQDAGPSSQRLIVMSARSAGDYLGTSRTPSSGCNSWYSTNWLVPSYPLPGETAPYSPNQPFGLIAVDGGVFYARNSQPAVLAPLNDVAGIWASSTHWVMVEAGATSRWAAYGCDAGACDFFETGLFPDAVVAAPYSVAAGSRCDAHLFLSWATDGGLALETVPWAAGCVGASCIAGSATPVNGATGAIVFNPADETTLELLTTTGSTFSISTGVLDSACVPTLTPVSTFTVPQGLISAQPVWMYGKPSALYLDGNGTVRLYVP